jgi:tetratricopeptide (TPR) repeat protein/tRNA A-37 threonylcarbamoyl transferase component Bud32
MASPRPSLRDLFETASDLPRGERSRYLDTHCDAELRARIESMLASEPGPEGALPGIAAAAIADAFVDSDVTPMPLAGTHIGPFELLGVLGEGGSSTVFHAAREIDGVRQDVALKLLRRGLYSVEAKRQFRRERIALSRLQHPGIARLIEGGITENGFAYIALELVRGLSITDYARTQRLDARARLRIFLDVCRAVDAAHRALIVHRDLKPSNVLVTADGEMKLLDFGIAKLLGEDDETHTRLPAFTPAYASPEQRTGGLITTATDVYALGVLLGELMTGERLGEESGRTPSDCISRDVDAGVLPAPPAATRRLLKGDLDNIVLKALQADPALRYASAGHFADDIERALEGRPVAAHPPSRWYRARKFVGRHKGGVVTTAAFLLAIFAALAIAMWQANVARQQARRADEQAGRAVAVRDFLISLLDAAQAKIPVAQKPTVDMLVASARERVGADTALLPSIRADVMATLGMVSMTYGDIAGSRELLEKALEIKRGLYAEDDPERWSAAVQLANAIERLGRFDEADRLLRPLLPYFRAHDSKIAMEGLEMLTAADVRIGKVDDALDFAREAAAMGTHIMKPGSREALTIAAFPGKTLSLAGKPQAAIAALEPIIAQWRAIGLSPDTSFNEMLNNLAVNKLRIGDYRSGESLLGDVIRIERDISPLNPVFATNLRNLARARMSLGLYAEAEAPLQEAMDIDRRAFTRGSVGMLASLASSASLQKEEGHIPAAEAYLLEAAPVCATVEGAKSDACARIKNTLATIRLQQDRLDDARSLAQDALEQRKRLYGERHPNVAEVQTTLTDIALRRGNAPEALQWADQAIAIFTDGQLLQAREAVLAKVAHADALLASNRAREASAEIEPVIAQWQTIETRPTPLMFRLLAASALASSALGDATTARERARQALALGLPEAMLHDDLRAMQRLATP